MKKDTSESDGRCEEYRELLVRKLKELSSTQNGKAIVEATSAFLEARDDSDRSQIEGIVGVQVHLRDNEAALRRAILAALGRIDAGTYGICPDCEEAITEARLLAVPWTTRCISCKEEASRERLPIKVSAKGVGKFGGPLSQASRSRSMSRVYR